MSGRDPVFDPSPHLPAIVTAALNRVVVPGDRLVVGISGGADSTALLLVLTELQRDFEFTLTAAHFDHRWRPESQADAEWVAALCRQLDVPCVLREAADTGPPAGRSEAAARHLRRVMLTDVARQSGARWVALGHTADDQAETVLHRLLRGTGLRGLAGIAPVAPLATGVDILRPLLDVRRSEIEAWLITRRQSWRSDATNADPRFTRNRIRRRLLPFLRRNFNPQVDAALCRLARQCRELVSEQDAAANAVLSAAVLEATPEHVRLQTPPLAAVPPTVRREALRALWRRQAWPEQAMTCEHWRRLVDLAGDAPKHRQWTFPDGIQAVRTGGLLRLQRPLHTAPPLD